MITKKRISAIIKGLFLVLPLFLGIIGFCLSGSPLLDAMYNSIILYAMEYNPDSWNLPLEIARWLAPAATFGAVFLTFRSLYKRIKDVCRVASGGATAVYGDTDFAETARRKMKKPVMGSRDKISGASSHILLFDSEAENLRFYDENKRELENKRVFIHAESISPVNMRAENLQIFSVPDMTARMYWQKHSLLPYYKNGGLCVKIALLGFGRLGQRLLDYALLGNIYSPTQRLEYHIWGDSTRYTAVHTQLSRMEPDAVIFHKDAWECDRQSLDEADRIIVAEESDEMLSLLDALVTRYPEKELHVYDKSGGLTERIFRHPHMSAFGNPEDILTEENIKTDLLYRTGKQLNYRYFLLYGGQDSSSADAERVMEEQWAALDGFTKYANLAAADYHTLRLEIIGAANRDGLTLSQRALDELEHIRWCRYHYLNNWTHGVPENGKAKDAVRRIHASLVPFEELSEAEKDKDTEMIRLLMELRS